MPGMKTVGLGIIGCGIAANELHWPAISRLRDEFAVVSVCNHTREKAIRLSGVISEAYGKKIPYVLDYRELLASPDVQAVSVILPVELNREVCTSAATAGKHILVEKPIAENDGNAFELLQVEERHPHLVMMVAENFRYRLVVSALADALRSGVIGAPYFVEWRIWQQIDPATNAYAQTPWRIHHRYAGGFVTDGGVHNVAALREVFGDLVLIGSVSASVNPGIGRTDTLASLFLSKGRAGIPPLSGVLSIGFSVRGVEESRMVVLGSHGSVVVDGSTLKVYVASSDAPVAVYEYPDDGGYEREYRDFHRAITTGARPKSTFVEAYGDLSTILSALRQADSVAATEVRDIRE
jgi:predicted dehydrogenase